MKFDMNKQTIKWFIALHEAGNLIINHDYQRRGVWLHRDKVKLVESVLLDFPIPEMYVWQRETHPTSGDTRYEIVDGQQRLRSIIEFITNPDFILESRFVDDVDAPYAGKRFEDLTPEEKQKFWRYQFVVREIDSEESLDNIRKMFLRLNRTNLSLNPQELRNAEFNGEFIKLSLEMSEDEFWKKYSVFNDSDIRRMLDIQFCSSILIFLRNGIQSDTQSLINRMYDRYNDEYVQKLEDKKMFLEMMGIVDIFLSEESSFAQKKSQLFTLFCLSYWFISNRVAIEEHHKANFREFCIEYNKADSDDDQIEDSALRSDLLMYKTYSIEGTGKKLHREQRFGILKKYVLGNLED
ncbi:DUF262 domain-containing protein [Peribacillus sp. SCS-37]|uniref:DUF262 domain-containing protein n=1 Tax=Paraperibacillus esterisolvens TaxID=3115296 RepID=UPI003905AC23